MFQWILTSFLALFTPSAHASIHTIINRCEYPVTTKTVKPPYPFDFLLYDHNIHRKWHHVNNLQWNTSMANAASHWVKRCEFKHDPNRSWGENLYATWYTLPPNPKDIAREAVRMWYDEVKDYNWTNPRFSHFTQVVWKDSKYVGCAYQRCKNNTMMILSCKYYPPGNVYGRFKENVLRH